MAIVGNVGVLTADISAAGVDTVVFDFNNRIAVSAFSIHNTLEFTRQVSIYASTDVTSASGKRVARYTLSPNESFDINEVIGQGYELEENIIAVQDTVDGLEGDLNFKLTYTNYTGGS
jgi:hypothetical protein